MAPTVITPAATVLDWTLIKGDDFALELPVLDAAEQAVDMTGWTAKAQVRRSAAEPVLHEWTTVATVEAPTPNAVIAADLLTLHVDGAITTTWGWTAAQISVEVTEPDGRAHTIARGTIRARDEITQ